MKNSREAVKLAGIVPKLQLAIRIEKDGKFMGLKSTGPQRVKILEDKPGKDKDPETGKERFIMKYYVEHDGEKKSYIVPMKNKEGNLHYLVQKLSEFEEGDEIIMEYQRKGIRAYINVTRVSSHAVELSDEEVEGLRDEIGEQDELDIEGKRISPKDIPF